MRLAGSRAAREGWLAMMLVTSAVVGCGGGAEGPATYPVTGVVTLSGKPVSEALVQFSPADGKASAGAQVRTDAEGRFDVAMPLGMGQAEKRGLPVGEYRVTVTKMEQRGQASLDNPPKNVLPGKYASVQSSPFKVTVKPEGENTVEVKL